MKKIIRIGNGQGFWGDSIDAPVRLAKDGPLDYLTLDYLAEVTLSIMQRQKLKNPNSGYALDFLDLVERILPEISDKGVKIDMEVVNYLLRRMDRSFLSANNLVAKIDFASIQSSRKITIPFVRELLSTKSNNKA